jgi:hypothetical protein
VTLAACGAAVSARKFDLCGSGSRPSHPGCFGGVGSSRDKIAARCRSHKKVINSKKGEKNEKEDTFRCNRISNGAAELGFGFLRNDPFVDG